jgi:hypothetical protein
VSNCASIVPSISLVDSFGSCQDRLVVRCRLVGSPCDLVVLSLDNAPFIIIN